MLITVRLELVRAPDILFGPMCDQRRDTADLHRNALLLILVKSSIIVLVRSVSRPLSFAFSWIVVPAHLAGQARVNLYPPAYPRLPAGRRITDDVAGEM